MTPGRTSSLVFVRESGLRLHDALDVKRKLRIVRAVRCRREEPHIGERSGMLERSDQRGRIAGQSGDAQGRAVEIEFRQIGGIGKGERTRLESDSGERRMP